MRPNKGQPDYRTATVLLAVGIQVGLRPPASILIHPGGASAWRPSQIRPTANVGRYRGGSPERPFRWGFFMPAAVPDIASATMSCSGCAQRRAALVNSLRAIRRAELGEAADRLKVAGRSAADDLSRLKQATLQAARNRLARR